MAPVKTQFLDYILQAYNELKKKTAMFCHFKQALLYLQYVYGLCVKRNLDYKYYV